MRRKMRRRQITVETDELFLTRISGAIARTWCPRCSRMVPTVRAEVLDAWVNTDAVHAIESVDGDLLICVDSLRGRFAGPKML